ncbi:MAG: hypothetical protein PHH00_03590 [Candidatus Nanoarchaeia archaeon]|nr:hypothetical protein [Candidatus Nanoarchaeia archaeon]
MGDKLRSALAISGAWTEVDINIYKVLRLRELGSAYLAKSIPVDAPADRARFLDEQLRIMDDGTDEKYILKIAEKEGRAEALAALERLAFRRFY